MKPSQFIDSVFYKFLESASHFDGLSRSHSLIDTSNYIEKKWQPEKTLILTEISVKSNSVWNRNGLKTNYTSCSATHGLKTVLKLNLMDLYRRSNHSHLCWDFNGRESQTYPSNFGFIYLWNFMSENIYEFDIGGSCSSERSKSYTLYTAQRSEMK